MHYYSDKSHSQWSKFRWILKFIIYLHRSVSTLFMKKFGYCLFEYEKTIHAYYKLKGEGERPKTWSVSGSSEKMEHCVSAGSGAEGLTEETKLSMQ